MLPGIALKSLRALRVVFAIQIVAQKRAPRCSMQPNPMRMLLIVLNMRTEKTFLRDLHFVSGGRCGEISKETTLLYSRARIGHRF